VSLKFEWNFTINFIDLWSILYKVCQGSKSCLKILCLTVDLLSVNLKIVEGLWASSQTISKLLNGPHNCPLVRSVEHLYPWLITYGCMWAVICSMIVLHSSSFNWRWGHATNKFSFLGSHDFKLSKRLAETSHHSILVSENNGLIDFVVLMRLAMPNIQQQTPHISLHQSSWS
jgi:hypothetical protein